MSLLGACLAGASLAAPVAVAAQQAGSAGGAAPLNTLTPEERSAGWRLLFDGKTTAGWRGWKMDSMPSGWQVVDGTLKRVKPAADIITTDKFKNFELTLEWNIAKNGNSGIFYRASEDPGDDAIYWSAPEMQVLDDAGHPDGKSRLTAAGSDYGLYPSPAGVVKPANEWNSTMTVVNGNSVQHWLNGQKLLEYEIASSDWTAKVKTSKFAAYPNYGRAAKGYIAIQGDHDGTL